MAKLVLVEKHEFPVHEIDVDTPFKYTSTDESTPYCPLREDVDGSNPERSNVVVYSQEPEVFGTLRSVASPIH